MNKKIIYICIILIIIIIFIKKKENYNDDIFSREALIGLSSVYAESNGTVYFNNQYTTGDLKIGNNLRVENDLHVNGSFNLLPRGVIVAYNSSTPPFGWAICDGTNNTPDLRGRFILGQNRDQPEVSPTAADGGKPKLNQNVRVGYDLAGNINTTGGEVYHKLTINEMPSHNHKLTSIVNSPGTFPALPIALNNFNVSQVTNPDIATQSGGDTKHNILPPYYVLTYIMKL
jgi:microcystin-dependent protein